MPFLRHKRGQLLLVHSVRDPSSGRVNQLVLHGFASREEIAILGVGDAWTAWKEKLAWRFPEIQFDWTDLHAQLVQGLKTWKAPPARGPSKVKRLAKELRQALDSLSVVKPADAAVLSDARGSLEAVAASLAHHLSPRPDPRQVQKEPPMERMEATTPEGAEALFDAGMEYWWDGDQATAGRYFKKALKLDPQHADANNHLGIVAFDRGHMTKAEGHFRAGIAGGERGLVREGEQIVWGYMENRPYLRALGNLALVHLRSGRPREALEIHERMLELNPNDNQGVRDLLGDDLHRLGELKQAIAAYKKALEHPNCRFGLALALVQDHRDEAEVGQAMLLAFAGNRYVAPLLLGESWKRLDGFHAISWAEPEAAADYVTRSLDLWKAVPGSAEALRFWHRAKTVQVWRAKLDHFIVRLKEAEPGSSYRTEVLEQQRELTSERFVEDLVERVLKAS